MSPHPLLLRRLDTAGVMVLEENCTTAKPGGSVSALPARSANCTAAPKALIVPLSTCRFEKRDQVLTASSGLQSWAM